MPKDIEWGDAAQPVEGGVMPQEPEKPQTKRPRQPAGRKSTGGRKRKANR
jgi:hypothetical protein